MWVAKRKSEVRLFAGTVLQLAEKHGIAAPVNQKYWDAVQKMESQYETDPKEGL